MVRRRVSRSIGIACQRHCGMLTGRVSSSAIAAVQPRPGRRRAKTETIIGASPDAAASGIHRSAVTPTASYENRAGSTPTTWRSIPFTVSDAAARSPEGKCCRHRRSLTSATRRSDPMSVAVNTRPAAGGTPMTAKNAGEAKPARVRRSAFPAPMVTSASAYAAMDWNEVARARVESNSLSATGGALDAERGAGGVDPRHPAGIRHPGEVRDQDLRERVQRGHGPHAERQRDGCHDHPASPAGERTCRETELARHICNCSRVLGCETGLVSTFCAPRRRGVRGTKPVGSGSRSTPRRSGRP